MLTILSIEKLVDRTDTPTGKTVIEFKIDTDKGVTLDAIICTIENIESFAEASSHVYDYFNDLIKGNHTW